MGATTYADVVAQFGNSTTIETSSDGSNTASYLVTRTHVRGAAIIPIVGLFAGGARGEVTTDRFEFGPDGFLKKTITSDTAVDCKTLGGRGSAPTQ